MAIMARSKPPEYIRDRRQGKPKPEPSNSQSKSLKRKVLEIFGVIGSLASLVGILAFIPHISVQQSGTVRSHDPYGTVFEISNDGPLSIHSVEAVCMIDVGTPEVSYKDIAIQTADDIASILSPGQKMTTGCHRGISAGTEVANAKLTIHVSYRPDWLWWRRDIDFHMEAIKADDGTWVWKHEAN